MTLFDLGPEPEPAGAPMSPDRRRQLRVQEALDAGVHPATGAPVDHKHHCRGCLYARRINGGARAFWKCEVSRLGMSSSAASDIRISWPACTRFVAHDDGLPCPGCAGAGCRARTEDEAAAWRARGRFNAAAVAPHTRCEACNGRGVVPPEPVG